MAPINSIMFLLLSINFFHLILTHSTTTSYSSISTELSQAHLEAVESERQFESLKVNKTIPENDFSVNNRLSNVTMILEKDEALNGSRDQLNYTEDYLLDEFKNGQNLERLTKNNDLFHLSNNSKVIEEVLNNTKESENYHQFSDEDTSDEQREGPLLTFDDMNKSEALDYETYDKEREPLMTLIFNELRVNASAKQHMTPDEKFVHLFTKMAKLYNLVIKDMFPLIIDKILTANTSFECMSALAKAYEAITTNQHWVYQMLDANGHFPSGLISGTLTSLGDYDQCLSVEDIELDVRGQYCLMKVKTELPPKKKVITFKDRFINLNGTKLENTWIDKHLVKNLYNFYYFSITNGICVPSACSQSDLVGIAKQFLDPFHLKVEVENCATKINNPIELNLGQKIALILIMTFIFVAILATIIEIIIVCNSHKYRNNFTQITECFSLRQNIRKFFDTSSDSHKSHTHDLRFIDGIKVLSMFWVIIGHTYISGAIFFNKDIPTANFYFANLVDTINLPKQMFTQFVFNGLLAVDTFFFISGFLVVYLAVIKIVQEGQQVNFHSFLFLRWIRFSPMLMAIMSMNLLWPLIGSGPLFHENYIKFMTDPCYKYWWRNLVFISNWYPSEEQCMIHTWYLSADFQYYIMAFFIIKITSSNIRNGMIACSLLVLLGVVIPTLVAFANNLPPTILYQADIESMALHASLMHYKSYNHLTPYFLGAFVACLLLRKKKAYINITIRCFFWVTTIAGSFFVVFITYLWTSLEWEYTRIGAALYFGSHRFIWSAGLAWITFNCAQNSAGIINSILSSNMFKLTSRLTFSIYLSHMLILWYNFFRTKHLLFSTHYDFLFTSAGVYGFTLVFAFINHILFELPVINLVKFIISNKRYTDKTSKKINNNNINVYTDGNKTKIESELPR